MLGCPCEMDIETAGAIDGLRADVARVETALRAEIYFEIAPNASLKQQLFGENTLMIDKKSGVMFLSDYQL